MPTSTVEVAGLGGDAKFVKFTGRGSVLSDAVRAAGSGRPAFGRRRSCRGLRQRRSAHLRPFPEQRPHDPRLCVRRHRPGRDPVNGSVTISAARPISMLPPKRSSRCRSFRRASVCVARCSPMRRRSTATRSSGVAITSIDRHAIARFGRRRPDVGFAVRSAPHRLCDPGQGRATDDVQEFNFGISTRF